MGIAYHDPVKVLDAVETNFSNVRVWTEPLLDAYRITLYAIWTGYSGATVQLQATTDGTNWMDIDPFLIVASNSAVSGEIGPFKLIGVLVNAAVGAGSDSIQVFLQRTRLP